MSRFEAVRSARGRWLVAGVGLLVVALLAPTWGAGLTQPNAESRNVTIAVTSLLRREHLSHHPLDDEIATRCMDSFLKMLDPMKLYFYQGDIDGFRRQQARLDDMLRAGDVSFAYEMYDVLLQRVKERRATIDELLAVKHDFTVQEEIITDPDLRTYPRDAADARDKWRKLVKYDLLVQKADELSEEEALEKLTRRYHSRAHQREQTSDDELLEMYLTALTTSFDPHTQYMSPRTLENFDISMRLELDGIGAVLQFDDGYTVVNSIVPGGAADKDGRLKTTDRVVGVGQGVDGEIEDVVDMKLSDVVEKIRGKRGTIVRLQVTPAEGGERKIYDITRAKIELKDSEARSEIFEETRSGQPFKIGVIDLPSFYMDMQGARLGLSDYKSTTRDVRRILDDFRARNVDAVIIDLRRNGGGSLTEAINLTGLFIDSGPIVQVKDAEGAVQHYDDTDAGVAWSGPLICLTSKFSASASEIFAGAIQDYGRGLIVGDPSTHGKGTVQSLLDLGRQLFFRLPGQNAPQLGALKITMQQFYRPNGDSTQNRGVLADIALPSITSQLDVAESDLDHAMDFDRVEPVPYKKLNLIDAATLAQLNVLSEQRRQGSEGFQKVLRDIERYQERKSRKSDTLHEETFLKERAELNAEREEEKQFEELNNPNRPVVERDYYFEEALHITLDYLTMSKLARVN